MFGFFDLFFIYREKKLNIDENLLDHNIEVVVNKKSKKLWICFLPWHTSIKKAKRASLLPKEVNLIIIEEPNAIINVNPKTSKSILLKLIKEVEGKINQFENINSTNILTLSAGSYPGFYFAGHHKIDKIIAVAGGAYLGGSIFSGDRTEELANKIKKTGFKTAQEYDMIVRGCSPIENIRAIPARHIDIHISMWDRFIKTKEDLILIDALKKEKKFPCVYKYHCLGHIETILLFGLKNRLGLIKF